MEAPPEPIIRFERNIPVVVLISIFCGFGTGAWWMGKLDTRVSQLEYVITNVQHDGDAKLTQLQAINTQLASLAAKVEILINHFERDPPPPVGR